jgi:hypothetical protein
MPAARPTRDEPRCLRADAGLPDSWAALIREDGFGPDSRDDVRAWLDQCGRFPRPQEDFSKSEYPRNARGELLG